MKDTVIKVENVSKQYRLGVIGASTLSQDLNRWWARIRGKEDPYQIIGEENNRSTKSNSNYVWALKDLNFELQKGEILGIIGNNGAGKSTLLKLLSKVTTPTTGKIKIKGRLASLLEVGTGFHPELTGKENIYLNGAILGMSRADISRKFDAIVNFAGVERYIDTPVKRYSSGMFVRLAFAVAAHLDPDILVVDEVLAVGDLEFQKKCIGKMGEVADEGRTVLFVSHQMDVISRLCHRCLLMDKGKNIADGPTNEIIEQYRQMQDDLYSKMDIAQRKDRKGDLSAKIIDTWIENHKGIKDGVVSLGNKLTFFLLLDVKEYKEKINVSIGVNDDKGNAMIDLNNNISGNDLSEVQPGKLLLKCVIPQSQLNVGIYTYNIMIYNPNKLFDWVINANRIEVVYGDFYNTGLIPDKARKFLVHQEWIFENLKAKPRIGQDNIKLHS